MLVEVVTYREKGVVMGRRAIIGVPYKLTSRGVSVTIVDKDKNGRLNGKVDHVLVHGSKVDPKVAQTKLRKLGIDLRKSNGATLKLFSGYVKEIKGALEYASKGNVVMARYCFSNALNYRALRNYMLEQLTWLFDML